LSARRKGQGWDLALEAKSGVRAGLRVSSLPAFARDLPQEAFRDLLEPVGGIRRLSPLARVQYRWELRAGLNRDLKTVFRIRTETGVAFPPGARHPHPRPDTLRILPLKGYDKESREVARFLWRSFGLRATGRSEMELAARAVGNPPGSYDGSASPFLKPDQSADEATRKILDTLLGIVQANRQGVLEDRDPEFLHDFRVAIRRTRSALGQMREVLSPSTLAKFEREFRWLGGRTGPTRDIDVYLLKIPEYRAALPDRVTDDLEPLVWFLEKKKRQEHRRLVRTLESGRYARLLTEWGDFLAAPAPEEAFSPTALRPILEVASERIWKLFKRILKRGSAIDASTPAKALHRLRIDCKNLRYLMTFFQSLYPPEELGPLIREQKRLQDNLGDFNDLQVQRDALRGFAEEMLDTGVGPPATLMAMGRLMGQLETRQAAEREAFRHHFQRFSRPKNVKRFRKLFGERRIPIQKPEQGPEKESVDS
jgi:CHAD domain-containing protein